MGCFEDRAQVKSARPWNAAAASNTLFLRLMYVVNAGIEIAMEILYVCFLDTMSGVSVTWYAFSVYWYLQLHVMR